MDWNLDKAQQEAKKPVAQAELKAYKEVMNHDSSVAPHVGAWIEIEIDWGKEMNRIVAPHVGAWIEIKWRKKFWS